MISLSERLAVSPSGWQSLREASGLPERLAEPLARQLKMAKLVAAKMGPMRNLRSEKINS